MSMSAPALGILVSLSLAVTAASPVVLIALFVIDWKRKRLW